MHMRGSRKFCQRGSNFDNVFFFYIFFTFIFLFLSLIRGGRIKTILHLNGVPDFCFQKLIKLLIVKTNEEMRTKVWNTSVFIISADA